MTLQSLNAHKLAALLKKGAIGVIPTDTMYGISCSAFDHNAVERVYEIRGRDQTKPFIILISSLADLLLFHIRLSQKSMNMLAMIWPAPISIILPCRSKKFDYLHREQKSLALRMPHNRALRSLLKKTGPLISTSVNPQGKLPATTIFQAKKYFGAQIDFYVSGGTLRSRPSTLVPIERNKVIVLHQGSYQLDQSFHRYSASSKLATS